MDSVSTLPVTTVEREYKNAGLTPPSLDEAFNPQDPAEALRRDPVVSTAVMNLVAAAGQIAAVVREPVISALNNAHAFQISSCLRAAAELNVAEVLREAGPQGLHVKEIAARSNTNPQLLARILRLLATHHTFREVSTDVFANNRISSTMDKGKPSSVLFEKPEERLLETSGISALIEFISEDCFKASSYLTDTMLNPAGPQVPHRLAFRIDESMFQWFDHPENKRRLTRFGIAMHGTAGEEPEDTIFRGFNWGSLPAGSVIVDVGGGLGASSLSIVKKYPELKVVNQDRGPVIEQSKAHWKEFLPSHVEASMVEFQAHNFLEPQPVKDAAAFLVRHVVHDWSDANVIIMLKHLRDAALPTTKLVIIENILSVASGGDSKNPKVNAIPIDGVPRPGAAPPLLPNFGMAGVGLYYYDLTVHNLLGGTERTLEGFYDVLQEAGWNLVQVYHCPHTDSSYVIADPI
ncbi:O-methyltransferase [Mycena sp. CBHHK59/15]|nr:O-methyltransferase [Mycena sp. CBHHK59/15]